MTAGCINLNEAPRSVQLFKINGFTASKEKLNCAIAWTRTSVGGYDWDVAYHPATFGQRGEPWVMFCITLASDDGTGRGVVASFAGRLVVVEDQDGQVAPPPHVSATLRKGQAKDLFVMARHKLASSGCLKDDSFVLELTITVLLDDSKSKPKAAVAADSAAPPMMSDLHKHFGELWRSQRGTDVTFLVAGEPVAAHRCVLAARSPVFMAELFGDMKETASQSIVIEDMEPEVFKALMRFIYTDTSPKLDGDEEEDAMAQHLLAAADRYGMVKLKLICEEKVCGDISVGTAAMLLVLAEQHGCPTLKARCMEFMAATPANLQAVIATEGYKHLIASCPSVLSDLLVAVI